MPDPTTIDVDGLQDVLTNLVYDWDEMPDSLADVTELEDVWKLGAGHLGVFWKGNKYRVRISVESGS